MNSQRKHLQYIMLYCFKKDDSANNIADKICTVYGNATTITTIRNLRDLELEILTWKMKVTAAA